MFDRMFRCQFEAFPGLLAQHDDETIRAVLADMKKAQIELTRILMNRAEMRARWEAKRIDQYVTDAREYDELYDGRG
jgi:hypothetical protein